MIVYNIEWLHVHWYHLPHFRVQSIFLWSTAPCCFASQLFSAENFLSTLRSQFGSCWKLADVTINGSRDLSFHTSIESPIDLSSHTTRLALFAFCQWFEIFPHRTPQSLGWSRITGRWLRESDRTDTLQQWHKSAFQLSVYEVYAGYWLILSTLGEWGRKEQ